ncbi:hypothetical protein BGZ93_009278 [Podila epicladia]|nr:hypothetical protein BGZ93_009278 [Podila epicladia]
MLEMSHTVADGETEAKQERRDKIGCVYHQLKALTRLKEMVVGCDVLRSSKVELDFTFETKTGGDGAAPEAL